MRQSPWSERNGYCREPARRCVNLADQDADEMRRMLADFCRLVGRRFGAMGMREPPSVSGISPRLRQTLQLLLKGDSEKQIARQLGISRHTVHIYVKNLYRHFGVNSRGELLALWIRQ